MDTTNDLRIREIEKVVPPALLAAELPLTETACATVHRARAAISKILSGRDDRLVVVVGPCSIHDVHAAREYGRLLRASIDEHSSELILAMRVYFEKPRTTSGWKGLVNDPYLDQSFRINDGLRMARHLLLDLAEMGVPAGVEFLDPMTPQYFTDLVSWGSIGARTTESQIHRQLASGLSCPVGFKNGTSGDVEIAVHALLSAAQPHRFVGQTMDGQPAVMVTTGNPNCHLVLRGGRTSVNYTAESVARVSDCLREARLKPHVMIDCSHGNSGKDHTKQPAVCGNIAAQIAAGEERILGVMLESNLIAGAQQPCARENLTYGQSITDACLGWEDTLPLLQDLSHAVSSRRKFHARRGIMFSGARDGNRIAPGISAVANE